MRINQSAWRPIHEVRNHAYGFDLEGVKRDIEEDRQALEAMSRYESEILRELPGRVSEAARAVLRGDVAETLNDRRAASEGADLRFIVLQSENPESDYTQCDSYSLFTALEDAIVIGPTGNNVRDIRILVAG